MLGKNELDRGETTAIYDFKEHSLTMIKCLILKYFGGGMKDEGKLAIDLFAKVLFYSWVGVFFVFEI